MTQIASFRFYEELNDFLPKEKRKVVFDYSFEGTPSVKDAIEALGIPHVEVDLILVNGLSVDFQYKIKDHDHISVYPVFETLDITEVMHLRQKPFRNTKFVLDVHLGKLARFLRILGFDSSYRNNYSDQEIIRISLDEHRIILTRDLGLLKVKAVNHGYFIRNQKPTLQLEEVLKSFDLTKSIKPFSRCTKCNGTLELVQKEIILDLLEPLTAQYFNRFFQCQECRSIYWEGSHYDHLLSFIERLKKNPANTAEI